MKFSSIRKFLTFGSYFGLSFLGFGSNIKHITNSVEPILNLGSILIWILFIQKYKI